MSRYVKQSLRTAKHMAPGSACTCWLGATAIVSTWESSPWYTGNDTAQHSSK